jgi:hypothetical protein
MSFLTEFHKQTATHWSSTGVDGYGEPTFAAPVSLTCRWEDTTSLIQDAEGNTVPSRSRVWLSTIVKVGDYLYKGVTAAADPRELDNQAYRVMDYREIPGLDGIIAERLALL